MTSPGSAIFGRLSGDSDPASSDQAIAAATAVPPLLGDRIYPLQSIQSGAFPFVAYEFTESTFDRHYQGTSGLSMHVGTIAVVGLTFDDTENLGNLVRDLINMEKGTWGEQDVRICFVEGVGDALETIMEIDKRIWRKDLQVTIWLAE